MMSGSAPQYYQNAMGKNAAIAGGIGALGSGLAGLFGGGGKNPYDAASSYYNKIPAEMQKYFDPYINRGNQAGDQLQSQFGQLTGGLPGLQDQYSQMTGMGQGVRDQFGRLMNDPNGVMNQIGSGYQQSPGYQWQLGQGMNAANNAAAAGGMAGSPQHQQQAAGMAEGLANQDYYNYMSKALGLYGTGLQGASNMYGQGVAGQQGLYNSGLSGMQGMNQLGFNASNAMAENMGNAYMNQGNMAFQGQANQNQSQGNEWGNIFGGLGALTSFGFG